MKQLVKSSLAAVGVELGRNPGWKVANLRKKGFAPQTVFDVGAAFGTPALYKAFPNAVHVLVEPLSEYKPHLNKVLQEYKGHYCACGAGKSAAQLTINVDPTQIMKSSFHERTELSTTNRNLTSRQVEVRTLDSIKQELNLQGPFGLKINAGGFEYQVVEGAHEVLKEAQFVIAEISVAKRFKECTSFADFVQIMSDTGFRLCDILDAPRKHDEIVLVNAVFRRID
jgi:FkbM family methyltransferase